MATATISTALKNARLDAITTFAGASALIKFYTGAAPANNGSITSQTLLGTLTCGSTFAPAASAGVLTLNTITQDSAADATGTAAWARLTKADGTTIVGDFDVTATGGGGSIQINTVSITVGGPISITSFTFTEA